MTPADLSEDELRELQRRLIEQISIHRRSIEALENQIKGINAVIDLITPGRKTG
jgi:hypothetical protein